MVAMVAKAAPESERWMAKPVSLSELSVLVCGAGDEGGIDVGGHVGGDGGDGGEGGAGIGALDGEAGFVVGVVGTGMWRRRRGRNRCRRSRWRRWWRWWRRRRRNRSAGWRSRFRCRSCRSRHVAPATRAESM